VSSSQNLPNFNDIFSAYLIKWSDIPDMAKRLGNPLSYEVKQPDEEASRWVHEWFSNGGSIATLAGARHLVLVDTDYCGMDTPVFKYNWIEVTLLGDRGKNCRVARTLTSPPRIGEWLQKICLSQRNEHCLSNIQLSQDSVCFDSVSLYVTTISLTGDIDLSVIGEVHVVLYVVFYGDLTTVGGESRSLGAISGQDRNFARRPAWNSTH
jgi:hypothetical protein